MAAPELAAGACVAGAVVAAELFVPEFELFAFFVATGFALLVAVAFVEEAVAEVDDEADATAVAPVPVTGAPAMLIALVPPN